MDHTVFRWINDLVTSTTWANGLMEFYAKSGIALFALFLIAGYLHGRIRGDRRLVAASIWAGGAPLIGLLVAQAIGRSVDRSRPYNTLDNVHLLLSKTADFSFPSDHATVAGAVAVGLFMIDRRLGLISGLGALLMAFARVYVGAHYPGDVLAGLVIGGAVAAAGWYLVVPVLDRGLAWVEKWPIGRLATGSAPEGSSDD